MLESTLVKKCQQKEPDAQRQLFEGYYNYVYTISFRYLKNHHDCEDVVSIIFNKVFQNIHKLTHLENNGLKRWIQTIAINESLRVLQKKHPITFTDNDELLDQEQPELSIEETVSPARIRQLVNEMPEGYRRVFLLHVVEGLTHTEIAEYLNISRNTSKSQMLKARKHLQHKLKNYESQRI
ncbi:MAG: sigma-70 family RNA polymerase sigma factor [Bacteroidota bacterium]